MVGPLGSRSGRFEFANLNDERDIAYWHIASRITSVAFGAKRTSAGRQSQAKYVEM
jgi:hypothetical protein